MKVPDLLEIAIAWKRSFNPTPEQEEIGLERMAVCNTCEFKEFRELTKHYACGACGCPLARKIYSPKVGACPKKKWAR